MRPYTPLELAGRDIYVREGCYACHSQMIRTLRSDVDRYGHFSLAAESMYDHPHQWGSKRTGPDLARIGLKYSDDWHVAHLNAPRDVVAGSGMQLPKPMQMACSRMIFGTVTAKACKCVISTAIQITSPNWMHWWPIFKCSEHLSISTKSTSRRSPDDTRNT